MAPQFRLQAFDAAVLVAYVAALACIGTWAARRTHKTTDDYFLASRSIPWLVTAASFLATCISALTFVGTPGEGYRADYRYLFSNVGDIAATIFVASFLLPVYQRAGVTSIYQYAAERFGPPVRTTCAGYFLLSRTLASTVRIVAIAKVLEVVSGGSLPYSGCVVVVIAAILAYTTLGGGRAIAWTDLMQFILLVSGALIALGYIVCHVPGGVSGIIDAGRHAIRPDGTTYNKFNFLELLKPENLGLFFLLAVWGFFQSSAAYGTDQDMVQRLLACNDPKRARWSLMLSGLTGIPITFLFLSIGVALYAYSLSHPELVAGMKDPDHIFPRFILTALPEGLRGLLLAAVASAAMGSSDSALASLSTAFTIDFYKPFWGKDSSEERCVKVSKLSFVGFGLLFMAFALMVKNLSSLLWLGFKIVAFTYGPLLGVYLTAVFTDWEIPPKRLILLMLGITLATFAMGMTAWHLSAPGSGGFWTQLDETYWRLYIIFGALAVPAGAYFLRS
ncbi:MAG: sodium/solute symporter [Elusimicrobia bacterium]|nr:sodium/solute symporter [Elusimicrobiota bacterium]